MNDIINHIQAFSAVGAVVIGVLVYGLTGAFKVAFGWEGRPVKQFQFWFSLTLGMLLEWLVAQPGTGWRYIGLTTLQGLLAGIAISLVALGVHNKFRPAERYPRNGTSRLVPEKQYEGSEG